MDKQSAVGDDERFLYFIDAKEGWRPGDSSDHRRHIARDEDNQLIDLDR